VLDTIALSACVALLVSAGVVFLTAWGTGIRLRRLEWQLAEWEERQMREVKQRAARASVESRQNKLHPLDEALIAQHTQHQGALQLEEQPWWDKIVK
jgi:hypothetical protein